MDDEPVYVYFDQMTWPNPNDPKLVEWALRYGTPTKAQLRLAASMCAAYKQLVGDTRTRRDAKVAGIRRALATPSVKDSEIP